MTLSFNYSGLQLVTIAHYDEMHFEISAGESIATIWPSEYIHTKAPPTFLHSNNNIAETNAIFETNYLARFSCTPTCTTSDGTPSDGVPLQFVTYIHYAVMVFGMLIGFLGIIYVFIILGHFIYYRTTP